MESAVIAKTDNLLPEVKEELSSWNKHLSTPEIKNISYYTPEQ